MGVEGVFFVPSTMLTQAHSLMSRLYLEAKAQPRSFHYTYPMERELYRYIEPSQSESTKEPLHLPVLVDLMREYFENGSSMWDIFRMIDQDVAHLEVNQSCMRTLKIYGPVNYTIYVDLLHDTHTYILKRLEYYTGVPAESIQLLSSGTVVEISAGNLFQYAIPSSTLSYIILPYIPMPDPDELVYTLPADYVPFPPPPLDFSRFRREEDDEPPTPSLTPSVITDYEGVD